MPPPPPGGGTVTISSPIDGNTFPTTFSACGTFTDDLPEVTYFPDMNDNTKTFVGTTTDLGNGVWKSDFSGVNESNANLGMITAIDSGGGSAKSSTLTVTSTPIITVSTPQPGDTVGATFPCIGTYDPAFVNAVDCDLIYARGPISSYDATAGQSYNSKSWASVFLGANPGAHNHIDIQVYDKSSIVIATLRIGEINIT